MQFFRQILACVLLTAITIVSHSQPHLAKTLLWRISGNGLQQPSYLFGTMHLTDKRLFNFDDSVYAAIEKTDGLAIEVNPDEMMAYVVNKMFDELGKGKKVQDMLDESDYKKYSPALEKKFKKPADEITSNDIVKEKNKWMQDYLKKGEMPTFVDAYLYNIAKKQGKWIGGIEDISDQSGLMDDMVDKSDIKYLLADDRTAGDNSVERMITTYASQDIEAIESLTNATTSTEVKDRLLINRNIKMARRIDSLAAFRTMFFAIGAAHLPGDSGVIELLQARGFTVEPVMSNRKIAADDYKIKEVATPWVEVKDEQGLYTAFMPGNPIPVKLYGLLDIKFMFDLSNFSGFYTMAVISPNELKDNDSLYDVFAKRMFKGKKIDKPKKLSKDGINGREFSGDNDEMSMRVQIYVNGKVMYMLMAYALKKENLASANTEKFFNSFTINKNYASGSQTTVFTDSIIGISFTAPAKLTFNPKLSNDADAGWKISTFTGSDMATGSYIMVFSKEVRPGQYIPNDSLVYQQFFEAMEKQYVNFTIKDTVLQGVHVMQAEGKNIKQPGVHTKIYNTIAGNRNIILFVIGDSVRLKEDAITGIFNSFRFIPHSSVPWAQRSSPAATFSTWAPSAFKLHTGTVKNFTQQVAYDTSTATSYMVIADTLDKYTWVQDDSSFWKERTGAYIYDDTIIKETPVQNESLAGMELLVKESSAITQFKRVRLLLDGNIIHRLVVNGDRATLFNDNTNKFFADFKPLTLQKAGFIKNSKAAMLLSDLLSSDSATRYDAYKGVRDAPFILADVPLLHDALFKTYQPLYDSGDAMAINQRIAQSLETLNSPATLPFVTEKYNKFTDSKDGFNNLVLSVLAGMRTKESYDVLAKLLVQAPPKQNVSYLFTTNLTDSLALTTGIYPVLVKFVGDSVLGLQIAKVTLTLFDSGFIDIKTLAGFEKDFIAAANMQLAAIKTQKEDDIDYNIYNLIELLGKFKTAACFDVLKNYAAINNLYIRKKAVIELLKNDQAVDAAMLTSIAADISLRSYFYSGLKDIGKEAFFPKQYLTQQYFAEAAVYDVASDNEDDDDGGKIAVQFLSKKTASYKGETYTFYLFKVSIGEGDDATIHLGVAGGYEKGSTGIEPKEEITDIYWKEAYDAKNIAGQLEAFLKNIETGGGEQEGE